jgi:biopolymer transport protein ExbB
MARVLAVGLRRWNGSREEIERGVEDAGGREVTAMTRRLRPLFVITTVAPLLGLLGTVMGMINAFRALAFTTGVAKPQLLAGGISQALVTTAAGLVVAIPAQCAYFWLKAKVEKFGNAVETVYENVVAKRLVARAAQQAA